MSTIDTRLPTAPAEWSKSWADRFSNVVQLAINSIGNSAQNNAEEASDRKIWFFG